MNKYDERYEIRLATSAEIDAIMHFIGSQWSAEHILSLDRNLFEYEFLNHDTNTVNVMIALDKNTRTIEALAGFLPCSHTQDISKYDVWGSFWKVNASNNNITFLGVELIKRLTELIHCRSHLGVGINPETTLPIRKIAFHEKTAKMKHYYLLNLQINDYKIAVINNHKPQALIDDTLQTNYIKFYNIEEIKKCFDVEKLDTVPYKDFWYINKRFFQHPYYTYLVYGLQDSNQQIRALIISREVEQFGRKVLRIVDYIGEQCLFACTGQMWSYFMSKKQYEYIDFYTFGFTEKNILSAGFVLKDETDTNIIPNYFEPFLQKNVDIWIRYAIEGTLFCKADGDQDRPNQLHCV